MEFDQESASWPSRGARLRCTWSGGRTSYTFFLGIWKTLIPFWSIQVVLLLELMPEMSCSHIVCFDLSDTLHQDLHWTLLLIIAELVRPLVNGIHFWRVTMVSWPFPRANNQIEEKHFVLIEISGKYSKTPSMTSCCLGTLQRPAKFDALRSILEGYANKTFVVRQEEREHCLPIGSEVTAIGQVASLTYSPHV